MVRHADPRVGRACARATQGASRASLPPVFRAPGWVPPSGRGTGGRTDCKPMKRIGVAQAGGLVNSGTPERLAVRHAGRVEIRFPPHELHRRRWAALGTVTLSASASTLTSALCPQASHVAITARTPFSRMFARVMGGPCFSRATRESGHPARLCPDTRFRLAPKAISSENASCSSCFPHSSAFAQPWIAPLIATRPSLLIALLLTSARINQPAQCSLPIETGGSQPRRSA